MTRRNEQSSPAEHSPQTQYDNMQGCLLRLFWTAAGNMALLALMLSIAGQRGFTLFDGGYWGVVAALASARYLEITRFGGRTLEGSPATMKHFRRYALRLFLVALALWIATHVVQRLL